MKTKQPRSEDLSRFSKKKLFLPFFLGGLMIFSVFAVIFSNPSQNQPAQDTTTEEFGGVLFTLQQGTGWTASARGKNLQLRYSPAEASTSFSDLDFAPITPLFSAPKIYLVFDPGEQVQLPLQELYNYLKPFTPNLFLACGQEGPGCEDLPLKTCNDASALQSVFIIRQDPAALQPLLTGTDFCFVLSGKDERDLTYAVDKLILHLSGISEP